MGDGLLSATVEPRVATDGRLRAAAERVIVGRTLMGRSIAIVVIVTCAALLVPNGAVAVRGPAGADIGRRHPISAAVREDDDLVLWTTDWLRPGTKAIDAWTATSSWDGDAVDYGAAIDAMME